MSRWSHENGTRFVTEHAPISTSPTIAPRATTRSRGMGPRATSRRKGFASSTRATRSSSPASRTLLLEGAQDRRHAAAPARRQCRAEVAATAAAVEAQPSADARRAAAAESRAPKTAAHPADPRPNAGRRSAAAPAVPPSAERGRPEKARGASVARSALAGYGLAAVALARVCLLASVPGAAARAAQLLNPRATTSRSRSRPIPGIEWQQDAQVYIARGNAVATRGTTEVHADTLIAHYREAKAAATRQDGRQHRDLPGRGRRPCHDQGRGPDRRRRPGGLRCRPGRSASSPARRSS